MVVGQEQIIEIIRQQGPLLPAKLAKAIGSNILIASAHLSNLVDEKKVLISNTKVGGSPVYYIDGQKGRLQEFASNLNEKDYKTFDLLKQEKILRDDGLDQLTRVSLRTIKDFAVPLQVIKGENKIIFWKWYLISNQEAEDLIKGKLEKPKSTIDEERSKLEEKKKLEEQRKLEEEKRKKLEEQKRTEQEKRKAEEEKRKQEGQKRIEERRLQDKKIEEERKKLEEERKRFQREKEELQKQIQLERQSLLREIETKKGVKKEAKKVDDPFLEQLMMNFREKKIQVVEHKIIRKKSEIDMVIRIPSVMGGLEYYCKAKNKKTVNDSDLSSAVVQGQLKKLPVLFLTTGELSKKAKEFLNTELKKGLVIKKI
ncbi:hypothetical protein KY332_02330 [Candidatus Woesearchaeota archaeon]|nr:hypothetical protein [Candidatus Woesearchaeota archaeon]